VLTFGKFDGVHLAHYKLLDGVVEVARPRGAIAAAITFEPHPIKFLSPARAPKLFTLFARKARLVGHSGIDLLVVLPFNRELAHLSPLEFVRTILVQPVHTVTVYVGPNFRFGSRQAGDEEILEELGWQGGFKAEVLPLLGVRGQRVTSTRIRELLVEGNVVGEVGVSGSTVESERAVLVAGAETYALLTSNRRQRPSTARPLNLHYS